MTVRLVRALRKNRNLSPRGLGRLVGLTPQRKIPLIPGMSRAALACEIATAAMAAHRARNVRAAATRNGMNVILPTMSRSATTKWVVAVGTKVAEEEDAQRATHMCTTMVFPRHRAAAKSARQGRPMGATVVGVNAAGPKPHLVERTAMYIVARRDITAAARQNGIPIPVSNRIRRVRLLSRAGFSSAIRGHQLLA